MALMTRKDLIEHSDFFAVQVFKDSDCIFRRYYKTYAQANEAFTRLKANVEHQMSRSINVWTDRLFKAWKEKDPCFEKVRLYIEKTWCGRYNMGQKSEELYRGDVWNHFYACLHFRFMRFTRITAQEDRFYAGDDIQKFYVDSLSFDEDEQNHYAFKLTSVDFETDVDAPRKWMCKEGIKTKK